MLTEHEKTNLSRLLKNRDQDLQDQGRELLSALGPAEQSQLALHFADRAEWRLATRCLWPQPIADWRLRRFAARCAHWRLEQERAAGREPREEAWRCIEAAEQLAAGLPEGRGVVRLRDLAEARREERACWEMGWGDYDLDSVEDYNESQADLTRIPGGAAWMDLWEAGGDRPSAEQLGIDPDVDGAIVDETWDAMCAAVEGASTCLLAAGEDEYGEPVDFLLAPRSVAERAWQRLAWQRIVYEGDDGFELVLAA